MVICLWYDFYSEKKGAHTMTTSHLNIAISRLSRSTFVMIIYTANKTTANQDFSAHRSRLEF